MGAGNLGDEVGKGEEGFGIAFRLRAGQKAAEGALCGVGFNLQTLFLTDNRAGDMFTPDSMVIKAGS